MSRAEQAAENRSRMPLTAQIVDQFRAVFGRQVRVIFAEEGGRTVGERLPVERSMDADQWAHYIATGERP